MVLQVKSLGLDRASLTRAWNEVRASGRISLVGLASALRHNRLLRHEDGIRRIVGRSHRTSATRPQFASTYYLAQALLLLGRQDDFRAAITTVLRHNPGHVDAAFLYSQLSAFDQTFGAEDRELLWAVLEKQVVTSKRRKLWLAMSYLVRNASDLQRMQTALQRARESGTAPRFHWQINDYCATAALRARDYACAKSLWRANLDNAVETAPSFSTAPMKPKAKFNPDAAFAALQDVLDVLRPIGEEPFLVSGTLLGMVRDGSLLPHDKDIDIGIWEDTPREQVIGALGSSGRFWVQPARSPETIRVKHINGTPIDVFYHFREGSSVWHGGVKARWWNSAFVTRQRQFDAGTFAVPDDADRYLEENYGDWRVPVKSFDSVYDTPNATIVNDGEMIVHDYRMACAAISSGRFDRSVRYLQKLEEKGEKPEFLDKAMELAA